MKNFDDKILMLFLNNGTDIVYSNESSFYCDAYRLGFIELRLFDTDDTMSYVSLTDEGIAYAELLKL